jgi:hypothetical protein
MPLVPPVTKTCRPAKRFCAKEAVISVMRLGD